MKDKKISCLIANYFVFSIVILLSFPLLKSSNIIFEVGATIDDVPAGITEDDTAVQAALETARKNLQEQAEKINYIVEVSQIILTGDGTWKLDIDNDLIFKAFTTVAAQNN